MDSSQLSVSWKQHSSSLAIECKNLLDSNYLVDCTLAAEGRSLKAHRLILSASSPYFRMLFSENSEKHPIVILKDVSFDVLKAVADFVYHGETQIPEGNLEAFLSLTKSLQIKGLNDSFKKDVCKDIMQKSPSVRDVSQGLSNDDLKSTNELESSENSSEQASLQPGTERHSNPCKSSKDNCGFHVNRTSTSVMTTPQQKPASLLLNNESSDTEVSVKDEPLDLEFLEEISAVDRDELVRNISRCNTSPLDAGTTLSFDKEKIDHCSSTGATLQLVNSSGTISAVAAEQQRHQKTPPANPSRGLNRSTMVEIESVSNSLVEDAQEHVIELFQPLQSNISVLAFETSCGKRIRLDASEDERIVEITNQQSERNYIHEVLERSAIGKGILATHKNIGMNNSSRIKLAELVIQAEFGANANTVISRRRFLELANLTVQCLPGEHTETYYIPSSARGRGQAASGKFYDAYTNTNKTLRKLQLRTVSTHSSSATFSSHGYTAPSVPPVLESEDFLTRRKLEFLRTRLEPWEELKECWESTSAYRQSLLRDDSNEDSKVSEYFDRYPILKQPGGHILLEIDFGYLFHEAQSKWATKWPLFSKKLKTELLKIGLKEDNLDCDAALLYDYPKLFGIVPVRIPGKKPWRASRAEVQEGFLVHLKGIGDLQKTLEGMHKIALSRGTQVQPFPLIIGDSLRNITSSYVVIDNRPILVESPLRSVEVAFKAYHALFCSYPVQSMRMWLVIAKAVFGIEDTWQSGLEFSPDVKRLINVLSV